MITREIIEAASRGETEALLEVLAFFDKHMDSLCVNPLIRENGKTEYSVDMSMKTTLTGKLLTAVLKFNPQHSPD